MPHRETGNYVRQIEGYRAFLPADLPPRPPVEVDAEMQALLSRADRALGRLDGSIQSLPNPDLFVFMYVRKEAVLSSQIEGTQASLNDVLEVEARVFNAEDPDDVGEVLNYVSAMDQGLRQLDDIPVSVRLIRDIHRRLMQGVRGHHSSPGEIRTSQNWIGPTGASLSEATFVPPPHHELSRLMGNLETYIHADDPSPLLIQIGIAHAQFETLHPFLDGNGRMGRLLITFLLCEREVLMKPVLYLSHYLNRHRQKYYDLLQGVRDHGDLEAWLKFFLQGVAEVSNQAVDVVRRIVDMREAHRAQIVENLGRGAGNGLKLLESLYQRPIVSVADIADYLGISSQAANTLAARFESLGLIRERTGNLRNRRFSYAQYIALFSEN